MNSIADLKEQGWKIFGYYCCYVPVEILTAAKIIPYRITSNPVEQMSDADAYLETVLCPWVRNTFAQALNERFTFLDGIIIPHACDAIQRMYAFWKYYIKLPYTYQFEIPHIFGTSSLRFFAEELELFKKSVEEFTGQRITDEALNEAIDLHNTNRELVRELYSLRKGLTPVPGSKVLSVLRAGMTGMTIQNFNALLRQTIAEHRDLPKLATPQKRIMISGCVIDTNHLINLIEECGAQVVMDDLPIGSRSFFLDVKTRDNPIKNLSKAYLIDVRCPRTVVGERTKYYKDEFKDRWGYLTDLAKEYTVDGVILHLMRFCDAHEYDFIDLKTYLAESGLPNLTLDDDCSISGGERYRTRIQAFIEMLQSKHQ